MTRKQNSTSLLQIVLCIAFILAFIDAARCQYNDESLPEEYQTSEHDMLQDLLDADSDMGTPLYEKAIQYGLRLRGAKYAWWFSGPLTEGPPAWNSNSRAPSVKRVKNSRGVFCAGLVNLMRRSVNKRVPGSGGYAGGTYAYSKHFRLYPFSFNRVRRGDAVFRPYQSPQDQGHIAISLGQGANAKLLQSFAWNTQSSQPGVNNLYTLKQSHNGGFYKYIIRREDLFGA